MSETPSTDGGKNSELSWYTQLYNALLTGDRNKNPAEQQKQIMENINAWRKETPLKIAELFNQNLPIRNAFWQRFDWTHEKFWVNEAINPPGNH